jgi:hypothetical protein
VIGKAVLKLAKSYLCWDEFPHLSIKLIEMKHPVAFFYPPEKDLSTILLFYPANCRDYTESLFLLFHEAGHYEQYMGYSRTRNSAKFTELINSDKGKQKLDFEQEAWDRGKLLLENFIHKYDITISGFPEAYFDYANKCLSSYL